MATLPEERVLGMVRSGAITETEGQQLINALPSRAERWRIFFNPFDQLSTSMMWVAAMSVTIGGLAVSQMGIRFDGSLDLHQHFGAAPWRIALLDAVSALVVTSLVFWITSLLVAKQGRLIDFVLSVAVARFPNVAVGALLPWILPPPDVMLARATAGTIDSEVVIVSLAVLMPGFIWFVILLCTAFKTSSGLKGLRLGIAFAIALVVSEILSKVFLGLI